MNKKKTILFIIISAIVVIGILVLVCNVLVISNASGKLFDKVEEIPHRKVGLVLGTAPVTPWGTPNFYFPYRMEAAQNYIMPEKSIS